MDYQEQQEVNVPAARQAAPPMQQAQAAPMARQMSVDELVQHVELVRDALRRVMKKDIHYGIIPGCQKPSLLQPGAELLCLLFRMAPRYKVTAEHKPDWQREWSKTHFNKYTKKEETKSGTCKGFVRYTVECELYHVPTGDYLCGGVGVATSWEPKFINRDPFESEETIIQFARKRALVCASRNATGASEVFTQDVEDMEIQQEQPAPKPAAPRPAPARPAQPPAQPQGRTDMYIPCPACPECGGEMWDNRDKKASGQYSPKSPDAACKDKSCKGRVWVIKSEEDAALEDAGLGDDEANYAAADAAAKQDSIPF